jgi:hypothetical protein
MTFVAIGWNIVPWGVKTLARAGTRNWRGWRSGARLANPMRGKRQKIQKRLRKSQSQMEAAKAGAAEKEGPPEVCIFARVKMTAKEVRSLRKALATAPDLDLVRRGRRRPLRARLPRADLSLLLGRRAPESRTDPRRRDDQRGHLRADRRADHDRIDRGLPDQVRWQPLPQPDDRRSRPLGHR